MVLWWIFQILPVITAIPVKDVWICQTDNFVVDCSNAGLNKIPESIDHNVRIHLIIILDVVIVY